MTGQYPSYRLFNGCMRNDLRQKHPWEEAMPLCGATRLFGAVAILAFSALFAQAAPFMIIGNDEKLVYDEAGKIVLSPAGKDSVSIVDLANPEDSKIVANLALKNSVAGPLI